MLHKIESGLIGAGVGYSAGKLANFLNDVASTYFDNMPSEMIRGAIFTGSVGLSFLVGQEYYHSKKMAKIYGHD